MTSSDVAAQLGALESPFTELLGLHYDVRSPDEVTAHLTVDPMRHLHPWGAVHGGVYCAIVETLATLGVRVVPPAAIRILPSGRTAFS